CSVRNVRSEILGGVDEQGHALFDVYEQVTPTRARLLDLQDEQRRERGTLSTVTQELRETQGALADARQLVRALATQEGNLLSRVHRVQPRLTTIQGELAELAPIFERK